MPKKRTKPTVDRYARFLRSLDLVSIALVESRFRIEREAFLDAEEDLFVKVSGHSHKISKKFFEVRSELAVRTERKGKPKRPGSFQMMAVFELHIHAEASFDRNEVKRFATEDLRLLMWPYFREYLANACGRMHVPPIILPLPEVQ
jgi:preprotein translocase subunit SecB